MKRIPVLVAVIALATSAKAVTIDMVTVGNPGNSPNVIFSTQYGAVSYTYQIGKYEVTNAQYAEFLNAKDSAGTNSLSLYSTDMASGVGGITNSGPLGSPYAAIAGREDFPVSYVSFYSAIRFANWMSNGQGTGDTESGSYTLLGGTATPSNGPFIPRNPGAAYFIPTEDEWYKAAYYNPTTNSYYQYPFSSNAAPTATAPTVNGNSANFDDALGGPTNVGAYPNSKSPYGAFDMGGNVLEVTDSVVGTIYTTRGGSHHSFLERLSYESSGTGLSPGGRAANVGFRIAQSVPEPSMLTLLLGIFAPLAAYRRRRG